MDNTEKNKIPESEIKLPPRKRGGETGADFVKKIRPVGCVLFLTLFITVTVLCFTVRFPPVAGYEAPYDSEYYREHIDELSLELNKNFLSGVSGVLSCRVEDGKVAVVIEESYFENTKEAFLYYYDEDLFEFTVTEDTEETPKG